MKPKTWNSNNINDGTYYEAFFRADNYGLPTVKVNQALREGRWPVVTGLERPGKTIYIDIYIRSGTLATYQKQLMNWFDPEDETPKKLLAEDEAGGNDRYVMAICAEMIEVPAGAGRHFVVGVTIDGDIRWRENTATTDTWSITATGQTKVLANGGEDDAYPILQIKPTSAKTSGYAYKSFVKVKWLASAGYSSYPTDICADGYNTTALIVTATATTLASDCTDSDNHLHLTDASGFATAGFGYITDAAPGDEQFAWTGKSSNDLTGVTRGKGGTSAGAHTAGDAVAVSKMLDNGADLRVLVDGVEVMRWLDGIHTTTTKVWVNLDWQASASATLGTAIASSGAITTITASTAITSFPSSGILQIDDEVFTYTGKVDSSKQFTGVTRAAKGTAMAAHTTTDTIYWLQHEIYILYGDVTASVIGPGDALYSTAEPMFELDHSTNTSWVYEEFGTVAGGRPGAWTYTQNDYCAKYTANQYTNADPFSEMGMSVYWFGEGYWECANPCQITNANFTNGEKRSGNLSQAWDASIVSVDSAGNTTTEDTIAIPSTVSTWEAWSDNEAITAGAVKVRLRQYLAAGIGAATNRVEVADVTLTISSTYAPSVGIGAEEGNYSLACTITNNTTGKAIALAFTMALNQELEVDTDNKTVTYLADGSNQFQALTVTAGPRRDWLKLQPGNNTIQFDDTGTAAVTIDWEWEERRYH
jgi:hypothetical protein